MNAINWNPFNTSEQKALDSKKVSFYKGIPVYRTNLDRSGSFAGIFLKRKDPKGNPLNNVNEVRHEYGHSIQERILGPLFFMTNVTIPSLITFWCTDIQGGKYHSMPWERAADWLGGVPSNAYKYKKTHWLGEL